MKTEDSLKKRYFYKLLTNAGGVAISFLTAGIVPRGLGPKAYGDFGFLTSFFGQVTAFFDGGTSTCFYQKLSSRQEDHGIITFYYRYVFLVFFIMTGFVLFSGITGIAPQLWPGQKLKYILLTAVWAFILWSAEVFGFVVDAFGLTVKTELAKLGLRFAGSLALWGLFLTSRMSLLNYYLYQFTLYSGIIVVFFFIIKKSGRKILDAARLNRGQITSYAKEFWVYSSPLVPYAVMGMLDVLLCRWLLQKYHGSEEQGYYTFANQLAQIYFIFASSLTPLMMREFSLSFGKKDLGKIAALFRKYIPFFYAITAYFACFVFSQANEVIFFFGGGAYKSALLPVMIMSLFPLYSTYGQLSNSVILATEQTRLYRNIGTVTMFSGMLIAAFLMLPKRYYGLDLGATGFAIKMLAMNFLNVNICLFFIARYINLNFAKYLAHQFAVVAAFIGLAFLAKFLVYRLIVHDNLILSFFISGAAYSAGVFLLVFLAPRLFGLSKPQLANYSKTIFEKMRFSNGGLE